MRRDVPRHAATDESAHEHGAAAVPAPRFGRGRSGLREFLAVAFSDWRLIAAAFGVTLLLAIAVSFVPSVKYDAKSRLLVLLSRDYIFQPQVGEVGAGISLDQNHVVRSEIQILTSAGLREMVLETLGVTVIYPWIDPKKPGLTEAERRKEFDSAMAMFAKSLTVEPVKDANVIQVSFRHHDPELAAESLNLLVHFYLEQRRDVYARHGSSFLITQREEMAARLDAAERNIQAFNLRHDITSLEDQKSLLLRQQGDLENDRLESVTRLRAATAQLATLQANMAKLPRSVPLYSETAAQAPALESAKARLLELEVRRTELLTKYSNTSRFVADIDQQIAQVREFIQRERAQRAGTERVGANPVFEQLTPEAVRLRAEIESLKAREESLVAQLAGIGERRQQLEGLEREHRALLLERQILQQQYQTYATKAEEARILEDMDQRQSANIRVIEKATPPSQGRNLQPMIIVLGLIAACFAALAVALFRQFTRQTLVTPESVERSLGLPVLVSVPLKGEAGDHQREPFFPSLPAARRSEPLVPRPRQAIS